MFIPDPTFFHPGSRIRIFSISDPGFASKNLSLNPKKKFLSSRKFDPDCSSPIRIPDPDPRLDNFSRIPDPGVQKAPDPGSRGPKGTGSRIRIRNTGLWMELLTGSGPGGAAILPGEGGDDEAQEETHADADQQGLSGMGLSIFYGTFWRMQ